VHNSETALYNNIIYLTTLWRVVAEAAAAALAVYKTAREIRICSGRGGGGGGGGGRAGRDKSRGGNTYPTADSG